MMIITNLSSDVIASSTCIGIISNPNEFDVLCGKDKTYSNRLGNQVFRALIDGYAIIYGETDNKQDKMAITRQIVMTLREKHGSRFLKPVKGGWAEISDLDARDKVSHALRFKKTGTTDDTEGHRRGKHLQADSTSSERPEKRRKRMSGESYSFSTADALFERQQQILGALNVEGGSKDCCISPLTLVGSLALNCPSAEPDSETESSNLQSEDWESILFEHLSDDDWDISEGIRAW